MVRHQPFFEALGTLGEDSDAWRRVFAGLVVLRLIDIVRSDSRPETVADEATMHSVRASVDALNETDAAKPILLAIVERSDGSPNTTGIGDLLLSYGRTLDLEAKWRLAVDVFETAAELAPSDTHPVAIDANILLGGSARRAGEWETSGEGYARAAHGAGVAGDTARALKAEVGMANTHFAHGNLPAAEELLETVEREAKTENLMEILELALHGRSTIAHNRGCYADAIELANEALHLAPEGAERDALLGDMATSFAELGMRDAARDAHLIVSVTSGSQWVVAQATINLMELASLDGMEPAFSNYATALAGMTLDVRHRAYYLLYLGQGQQRFGKLDAAARSLEDARSYASANGIHQIAFEVENALSALAEDWATWPTRIRPQTTEHIPESARHAARELTQMRELAFSAR